MTNVTDAGPGSLRQAMEDANNSPGADEIRFDVDGAIYLESSLPALRGDLVVDASGRSITIEGVGNYRFFEVPAGVSLRVVGLELRDGFHETGGGAIWSAGTVELLGCYFSGSYSVSGGAVFSSGSLTVGSDTQFLANGAESSGGAIYNTGTLLVDRASFRGNFTDNDEGGAIYNTASGVTLMNAIFTENNTTQNGGAIYTLGSLTVQDSVFERNISASGALTAHDANLVIRDTTFADNIANNGYGGGVYANAFLEIEGGGFSGNYSINGGAIGLAAGASGAICGSAFNNNEADLSGGAIFNAGQLFLEDLVFTNNHAGWGGAIANRGNLQAERLSISNNSADAGGGGIDNSVNLNLRDTTLDQNLGYNGGALLNSGDVTGLNVTFSANEAEEGGAIYNTGGLSLEDSLIENNKAGYQGGAIANLAAGELNLLNVNVRRNEAIESAAIFNAGVATLQDSLIAGNIAQFDTGGAIHNRGSLTSLNTDFTGNWITNGGGAIFNNGSLQIDGGRFSSNFAKWGAAIHHFSSQPAIIRGVTFESNSAGHYGGAILNSRTLTVEDCVFNTNRGAEFGAGIFNEGNLVVRDSSFSQNIAGSGPLFGSGTGRGASLYNWGLAVIENSSITGGTAYQEGGGIYNSGQLTLREVLVASSRSFDGGGIYNDSRGTITIHGGRVADNTAENTGGGIFNQAELTLDGGEVSANSTNTQPGAGIYNQGHIVLSGTTVSENSNHFSGGGIYNTGRLEATECEFTQNQAVSQHGGGLFNAPGSSAALAGCTFDRNQAGYWGGGIYNAGSLTLETSTLKDNFSFDIGGGLYNLGTAMILKTTIDHNETWNYGGGVSNGGILDLIASTISRNQSWIGGGIYGSGRMTVTNTTFSANYGEGGGAAMNVSGQIKVSYSTFFGNITLEPDMGAILSGGGQVTMGGNLISGTPDPAPNCSGSIVVDSPNISDDASCSGFFVADPRLGPLQDNGGPTLTHALLYGSPALEAAAAPPCPATDQRGVQRPQGLGCDIGAYEAAEYASLETIIGIDIRPKTAKNILDPHSTDSLAVALLSAPGFDAPARVDINRLTFGASGLENSLHRTEWAGKLTCYPGDVNSDGLADLVCTFDLPRAGFTCSSTQGYLHAQTLDGAWLVGRDVVIPAPCR